VADTAALNSQRGLIYWSGIYIVLHMSKLNLSIAILMQFDIKWTMLLSYQLWGSIKGFRICSLLVKGWTTEMKYYH